MTKYLFSGSYTKIGFPQNFIDELKKDLKKSKNNFVFIPIDFKEKELNDGRSNKIISWFQQHNINFNKTDIIDNRFSKKKMQEIISNASIIFLYGGDTIKQIENMKKYEINKYIKDTNAIIIGMSAGAMNMAKKVVLAKDIDDNIPELTIYEGLGLVDINIEPHVDFTDEDHWENMIEASFTTDIYCLSDTTTVKIKSNELLFLGSYAILSKGKVLFINKEYDAKEFIKLVNKGDLWPI